MGDKNKELKKTKPVAEKQRSNTLLMWVCVAAIAVITYIVFSPSLDNGFTNWDDPFYVKDNPLVVNNAVPLVKVFETPVAANYHPLTILSLALNYQNGKLDPYGYHLENVILHVLNTILVFFFIFLLTRRNLLMAVIVALFFGIHPMHVESVSWVSERKDVLYVFFFMAGLITYLRYRETRKMVWYFSTFLLFILSCLSKGMAVVFPVILLLVDYLISVKWERRFIPEKIPFFLLSLVFGIIAVKVQQSAETFFAMKDYTIFQRLLFASYGAVMYMVKFFVPFKLSAFYPYPGTHGSNGIPLIFYLSPFILLGIVIALIYFFIKKEKEIVFGLLFYYVSVVFVLQFISVGHAIMADRYSYLSSVGLLFIAAYLINKAWQSKSVVWSSMKYPLIAIAIVGAFAFSFQTYSRTQVWKNSEILWTNVLDNYPDVSFAYYDLGIMYINNYNNPDEALADFTKAIECDSANADAYNNRGLIYSRYGKFDLAIADYKTAIKIDSAFAGPFNNLGLYYLRHGKNDSARVALNRAIALDSSEADAYSNRGLLYLKFGKNDSALTDFNKAIARNSSVASYYYNRGLCYKATNQYEKAADDFTIGIRLNAKNIELYFNMRGVCYINLQKYDEAISDFSKAIELNASAPDYWINRSFAESKAGQNEMAKADSLNGQQLQGK